MDPRPVITCIVGMRLADGDYIVKVGDPLTLEQAELFAHKGWEVILDPDSCEAFARWEQLQRGQRWNAW